MGSVSPHLWKEFEHPTVWCTIELSSTISKIPSRGFLIEKNRVERDYIFFISPDILQDLHDPIMSMKTADSPTRI